VRHKLGVVGVVVDHEDSWGTLGEGNLGHGREKQNPPPEVAWKRKGP
jgi:hypothetical protein